MAVKDKIADQKVKHKGIFNFRETYDFLHDYLTEEGFGIAEKKYEEEVAPGEKKKIEISWSGKKKFSDYFSAELSVSWKIIGMKTIEVERDGVREKMNDGSVEIKISGTLVKDPEGKWENNPSMKFLRGVYDKYIIERTAGEYEGKVESAVKDTADQVKSFLVLEAKK